MAYMCLSWLHFFNRATIFEFCVVRCGLKNGTLKRHVLKREQIMCLKFVDHSRLISQHYYYYYYSFFWGGCDDEMSSRIFPFSNPTHLSGGG